MGVKVALIRTKSNGEKVYGLRIDHKGKRRTISIGSEAAAKKAKPKAEESIALGTFNISPKDTPSFADVASKYLAMIQAIRAPRTYHRYNVLVARINKEVGSTPIDKISRGDIRSMLIKYHSSGASKASVELMHTVCSGVFGYALDDELIKTVPTKKILSKLNLAKDSKEINPFSMEEMLEILSVVDQNYRLFFFFLYSTGTRLGEAAAVEWSDVDFRNKTIKINKTAKNQRVRNATKTYLIRDVDMSESLLTELIKLKAADKKWCFSKGVQQKHIFHNNGVLIPQQTVLRKIKKACETVGIAERTVHDIRHTTASILLSRGVPVTYVSKLLGHSSPRITFDVYSHYMPSENKGAINVLDQSEQTGYKLAPKA